MPTVTLTYDVPSALRIQRAISYLFYPDTSVPNFYSVDPLQLVTQQEAHDWIAAQVKNLVLVSERREEEAKVAIIPDVVIT